MKSLLPILLMWCLLPFKALAQDTTPPTLTLNGDTLIQHEQYRPFVDPGYFAYDPEDGPMTEKVEVYGKVDTSVLGSYQLRYEVKDQAGNEAPQLYRRVVVIGDTTAPEVESDTIYSEVHHSLNWPKPVFFDHSPGPFAISSLGAADTSKVGIYLIKIFITDTSGNKGTSTRTVIITDTTRPVIIINGDNPMRLQVFNSFEPPIVQADDNYCITEIPVMSGSVDTSRLGTYLITYLVTDCEGNTSSQTTLEVNVIDTIAPVLILPADTVEIEVFSPFNVMPQVKENYYAGAKIIQLTQANIFMIGYQWINYVAIDSSGNVSDTVWLVLYVRDTKAPRITLLGPDTVEVLRWHDYNDPGFFVSENYDDFVPVKFGGSFVNTQLPGTFIRTYYATDESGNTSGTLERTIIVLENAGLKDEETMSHISLYPNPSEGQLTVGLPIFPEPSLLILMDVYGHKIKEWRVAENTESQLLQLDELARGIYILVVRVGNEQFQERLILR